jgi:DnaJ-domain-containing protein 1
MWKILFIILVLLYALWPYDLLPDLLIGWGWLDDLVIIGFLLRYLYAKKLKPPRQQADDREYRQSFGREKSADGEPRGEESPFRKTGVEKNPYEILGLKSNASQADIKQAYRELANKYHPDKVLHLGEEFRELAEKRFKEIQQAYQYLTRK